MDTLCHGYRIPFQTPFLRTGQLREYLSYIPGSDKAYGFWGEVNKMLEKGAVETLCDQVPAFCNRLFLVDGGP